MKPFAELLERLIYTPQRSVKERLLADYFRSTPDPDRGWALAAITGSLSFRHAKAGLIRELAMQKIDPVLFGWSYDFVGDLAETTALIWPEPADLGDWPPLSELVEALVTTSKAKMPDLVAATLDRLDANGRWAFLKLLTGGMRVGVSARSAKLALAAYSGQSVDGIEEVWHGLEAPYLPLFAWLDGCADRPDVHDRPIFHPLMLANPISDDELAALDLEAYVAEWKWDGIRVQLVARGGEVRLYSRTGDDISPAFPDITDHVGFEGVLDGELLVRRDEEIAPFNDLQQRLNRKAVTPAMLKKFPAFIHFYDILFDGDEDLRSLDLRSRRQRLEAFVASEQPSFAQAPEQLAVGTLTQLDDLRQACRGSQIEGLMLKRLDSVYVPGRPKGPWFKWKRDPLIADCVMMYAQRGHGKRSSFYSDYTFGAWREAETGLELVPVGKAYFGFTDEELAQLDRWVRGHTTNRFGPVREVEQALVLEVAFDSIHPSPRHKSGVAMRFPRVHRIRWDKPAHEADLVSQLQALI